MSCVFGEVTVFEGLEYSQTGAQGLFLDLYRPEGWEHPVPVAFYLHGGAFVEGDKSTDVKRIRGLAERGIAVASVNYRLAPKTGPSELLEDVSAAIRWVSDHGEEYGLRTDKVSLWGASAGAHIAAKAGMELKRETMPGIPNQIAAVVCWFGLFDFVLSSRRTALEGALLAPGPEANLLATGGSKESEPSDPDALFEASVYSSVDSNVPPFLLMHGDSDHIVPYSESESLHHELRRSGVRSNLMLIGGAGHEDSAFDEAPILSTVAAFLKNWQLPAN